jgi:hypothetical protein
VDVDPLASMRCWAIELELGGRTYDVPALPAVDWWPVLTSGDLTGILDFVVSTPGTPFNLDDLILDGKLNPDDLGEVLTDALEAAAGRSLHSSIVLAAVAMNQWASINGALVARGFRWDRQPLGAALDAIYAEVVSRLSEENLTKFLALLENQALTKGGRKAKVSEKAVSEFEGFAGPRPTSGAKSTGAPSDNVRPRTRTRPRPRRQGDPSPEPTRLPVPRAGSDPAASS